MPAQRGGAVARAVEDTRAGVGCCPVLPLVPPRRLLALEGGGEVGLGRGVVGVREAVLRRFVVSRFVRMLTL